MKPALQNLWEPEHSLTSPLPIWEEESRFDMLYELKEHRDKYAVSAGDDKAPLSMTTFPNICRHNIDRIRSRVEATYKPGMHPAIAASIYCGVGYLSGDDSVRSFLEFKERFNLADENVDGLINSTIASFFDNFNVEIPGGRRLNVTLPLGIHSSLSGLSSELGIPKQLLAVICIMHTLSIQPATVRDDAREMASHVEKFLGRVKIRLRGASALMTEFGL